MRKWSKRRGAVPVTEQRKQSVAEANRRTIVGRYGLTLEDYDRMFANQNGRCAICDQPESSLGSNGKVKNLSIDHCHDTGKVRGLLCNNCNRAIGLLGDNPKVLLSAIKYLDEGGVKT